MIQSVFRNAGESGGIPTDLMVNTGRFCASPAWECAGRTTGIALPHDREMRAGPPIVLALLVRNCLEVVALPPVLPQWTASLPPAGLGSTRCLRRRCEVHGRGKRGHERSIGLVVARLPGSGFPRPQLAQFFPERRNLPGQSLNALVQVFIRRRRTRSVLFRRGIGRVCGVSGGHGLTGRRCRDSCIGGCHFRPCHGCLA